MNCSTVSDSITSYFNIIENKRKMCEVCKKEKRTIKSVTGKLTMSTYGLKFQLSKAKISSSIHKIDNEHHYIG